MRSLHWILCSAICLSTTFNSQAQTFAPPEGGWAYTFDGAAAEASDEPFLSLDGTWDHMNGSDEWDGSEIGDGNPGGVSALMDGDTSFIRVQDPGDPRDHGFEDPGSNRKVYLTHNLFSDFEAGEEPDNLDLILDDGITLYFRTRVATAATGPLDDLHADGGTSTESWPEQGIGYSQHNSGKSLFAVKQTSGANIAIGFDYGVNVNADLFIDEDDNPTQGLILPHILPMNEPSEASDPNNAGEISNEFGQVVPVEDMTVWQDFWITIQEGTTTIDDFEDGSHVVNVYYGGADSPTEAMTFGINAADGTDYRDGDAQSYIAIGAGATPRAGAYDVDFFSWAPGLHTPTLASTEPVTPSCSPLNDLAGDLNGDNAVGFADFLILSDNFGSEVGTYEEGDIDCNGEVAFADFLVLSNNFGQSTGAEASSVPEPSGLALFGSAALLVLLVRKRRS